MIETTTEKTCAHCGEAKPREAYGKDRSRKDGLEPRCKTCRKERHGATYIRKGHPTSHPARQRYEPGHRFGALVLVERLGEMNGTQYALCRCDCGNEKRVGLQNLASGATINCADRGQHTDPRRQETVTYDGAHNRIRAVRGSASAHQCAFCGQQAEQWAYSHADYDEARMDYGKEQGKPYSTNPDYYWPMCRPCHKRMDNAHGRISGEGTSLAHIAFWAVLTPDADEDQEVAA